MIVELGIPYWGIDPIRRRNFVFTVEEMMTLSNWQDYLNEVRGPHERGGMRNHLVRQASGNADVVVLCDADSFPEPRALQDAIWGAYTDGGLHFAFDSYRLLNETGTVRLVSGESDWADHVHAAGPGSLGGCFAIRPSDWWKAGGSPELTGWGFEDVMFAVQARTFLRENTWHPGVLTCLYHPTECSVGSPQYEINIAECKRVEALDRNVSGLRKHIEQSSLWP